jgi:hypothetical protein
MLRIDILDIRLKEHVAVFERMRGSIYGDDDGKPGIDERLRNIERDISRISSAFSKVVWPLVGTAMVGTATLVWEAFRDKV